MRLFADVTPLQPSGAIIEAFPGLVVALEQLHWAGG